VIQVEVTLWPGPAPRKLEVRLFGELSLVGGAECAGRVVTASGEVLAEASLAERRLTFSLPVPDLAGLTLSVRYRRGEVVLRLEVMLQPPAG
jgi:hypothetical protein